MLQKIGWGIDVGVGSIGFSVVELDNKGQPSALIDGVVEIFPSSIGAAERRLYKSTRTQHARRRHRKSILKAYLARLLDLPQNFNDPDSKAANPGVTLSNSRIELRANGLDEVLQPLSLARAIMHIAENRGQRLSRGLNSKDDKGAEASEKERQGIRANANSTAVTLNGLSECLARPAHPADLLLRDELAGRPTRLRKDRKDAPVFTRVMMEAELRALLTCQAKQASHGYNAILTETVCGEIFDLTFFEEDPKLPKIGKCRYRILGEDGQVEDRLPVGTDLFQCKRIYEETNNIRVIDALTGQQEPLCLTQRNILADEALSGKTLTAAGVRKLLGFGKGKDAATTNLDIAAGAKKKGRSVAAEIKGHELAGAFLKAGHLDLWNSLTAAEKDEVASLLREEDDFTIVETALSRLGLTGEAVEVIAGCRVSSTRSATGKTAARRLLVALKADVVSSYEAAKQAGLDDPTDTQMRFDHLPYYGLVVSDSCVGATSHPADTLEVQYGRIPNPVVHQSLNRIRKMANAFLKLYGKPDRICVELARDLNKSLEDREEIESQNAANGRRNDAYVKSLLEGSGFTKRRLSSDDLLKIKLHRMQKGLCLYTGKTLSAENLFDGSTEIDHILPRAETLDDGLSNLALVTGPSNFYKAKRSPYDAFHGGYLGRDYAHILAAAKERGPGVFWRFQPDALEQFKDDDRFRERFLNDTRYIGKVAAKYLGTVCNDPNGVVCLNGRLTGLLRRHWGLDGLIREIMVEAGALEAKPARGSAEEQEKKAETPDPEEQLKRRRDRQKKLRLDHRHHLLDAIVAACTTRADVKRISTLAGRVAGKPRGDELDQLVDQYLELFPGAGICWRSDFRAQVKSILTNDALAIQPHRRPATRVVHRLDHGLLGELHAKTNFSVIAENPLKSGSYIVKVHKDIQSLANEKSIEKALEAIDDMGTAQRALAAAVDAQLPRWWGGDQPVQALGRLKVNLADLRAAILALVPLAPEDVGTKREAQLKWAIGHFIETTGRRRYTKISVQSVRILKGPDSPEMKPKQINATGDNFCIDVRMTEGGDPNWSIQSRFDANQQNAGDLTENGRLMMTLHKNDIVEMLTDLNTDARRGLFRVVTISENDVRFLPVEEARPARLLSPPVLFRPRTVTSFWERKPQLVTLDRAGRIVWRGKSVN